MESPWDLGQYHLELLSPFHLPAFTKGTKEGVYESVENTAYVAAIFGIVTWSLAAISGGGASMPMWFGMGYPGWREVYSAKYALKKDLFQGAMRLGRSHAVRSAALLAAEAYMLHELYGGMTKNMSMESVDGVPGAMSHPFEGSSDGDIYYPGKSLVDWISGW